MLRQRQTTAITIRPNRPPDALITILEAPASKVGQKLSQLTATPSFQVLRSMGIIRRHPYGRIPIAKYQDYMDRALVNFARDNNLDAHFPDWLRQLTDASGQTPEILAQRFGTPITETIRIARYLRGDRDERIASSSLSENDVPSSTTDRSTLEDTDAIALIARYTEKYGINLTEFRKYFLADDYESGEVAERFSADRIETQQVLDAVSLIRITDSLHDANPAMPRVLEKDQQEIIGNVSIHPYTGAAVLDLQPWLSLCGAYYIDRESANGEILQEVPDAQEIFRQTEVLGQYGSLLRLISEIIVQRQEEYFITGRDSSLSPLPQAWIARECAIPRSSVCRIIKGKDIETPWGHKSLYSLCCSVGYIVRAISIEHTDWTAKQISDHLRSWHGVNIAIRTASYHKGRN